MLGEHERTDSKIHHRKTEVETLPQWNRPIFRTIHERADQRAEREAGEYETGELLHMRLCGERDDRNACGRLERAQTEPRHAHRNQARTPNRFLAACRNIRGGLLHRGLHLSGRLAFRTSLVARVFYCRFGLQSLGTGRFALTVLLTRHTGLACQLRLRLRFGG